MKPTAEMRGVVITGPGFYTSKAGKCEVVAIRNGEAIGWSARGYAVRWDMISGFGFRPGYIRSKLDESDDITSIWIDEPKPIEVWAIFHPQGLWGAYATEKEAEKVFQSFKGLTARLVHLIEAEDRT